MWIINILPDWIFDLVLAAGVIGTICGFVLGFIPLISRYRLPIQIISVLVLTLGVYLQGAIAERRIWDMRVKEAEAKVAEAQAETAKKNVEIVERVVYKTQVVRERGRDIIKYVDREVVVNNEVVKFVENCPVIPAVIVEQHNAAATLNEAARKP